MPMDEVFSGEYSNDGGTLRALDSHARQYARLNDLKIRRSHNRSAFSLLKEVFGDEKTCDEERIRSCYGYYLDEREKLMLRDHYRGDVISLSSP